MAVVVPGEPGWEFLRQAEQQPWTCFLCAEPVSAQEVSVSWSGAATVIFFHARCAASFVLRLARDAWEAEHAGVAS